MLQKFQMIYKMGPMLFRIGPSLAKKSTSIPAQIPARQSLQSIKPSNGRSALEVDMELQACARIAVCVHPRGQSMTF